MLESERQLSPGKQGHSTDKPGIARVDQDVRTELNTLHERLSSLKERVVTLEAQTPHINAALVRIEKSVEKLNGHLSKAIWAGAAALIAAVAKFVISGGLVL